MIKTRAPTLTSLLEIIVDLLRATPVAIFLRAIRNRDVPCDR